MSAGDIKFGSKYTLKLHIFASIPDIETNFESKYIFLWSRNVMKYVSRKKKKIFIGIILISSKWLPNKAKRPKSPLLQT